MRTVWAHRGTSRGTSAWIFGRMSERAFLPGTRFGALQIVKATLNGKLDLALRPDLNGLRASNGYHIDVLPEDVGKTPCYTRPATGTCSLGDPPYRGLVLAPNKWDFKAQSFIVAVPPIGQARTLFGVEWGLHYSHANSQDQAGMTSPSVLSDFSSLAEPLALYLGLPARGNQEFPGQPLRIQPTLLDLPPIESPWDPSGFDSTLSR